MDFLSAIGCLKGLEEDSCVPKNVKLKLGQVIKILETKEEQSLKVSKALHELEEMTEDTNMQADTRTVLYNIVSLLEMR